MDKEDNNIVELNQDQRVILNKNLRSEQLVKLLNSEEVY